MGQDKALLKLPHTDLLLWQHQIRTLEELQPRELFWSGPARPDVPETIRLLQDTIENVGPLAGISASLNVLQTDLLVVLAIDLPLMPAAFLRNLLARCSPSCGAVVKHDEYFEPLAAVYPKSLQLLAAEHLEEGRYALQDFVREAVRRKALEVVALEVKDAAFFKNLNSPADLR